VKEEEEEEESPQTKDDTKNRLWIGTLKFSC
jgi:hypothetical protein